MTAIWRISLATFPGQAGNPVGFAAAPLFNTADNPTPGALTTWPGGGFTSNTTYKYFDFPTGTDGTTTNITGNGTAGGATVSNVTFIGCRFQSGGTFGSALTNVSNQGSSPVTFSYCSMVPYVSAHPTVIGGGVWPSNGAGTTVNATVGVNWNSPVVTIPMADGWWTNAFFGAGPILFDHCDMWGFLQGAIQCNPFATNITARDCWVHDAAYDSVPGPSSATIHTDGIGSWNGVNGCTNIVFDHCTVASIGNTFGIGFQGSAFPYSFLTVSRCYISGWGRCIDMCSQSSVFVTGSNNLTVTDNVFGTDLNPVFGAVYNGDLVPFTGTTNLWRRNKIHVVYGGNGTGWTPDGAYMWPDGTIHAGDWTG